jgi:hypothetical protein
VGLRPFGFVARFLPVDERFPAAPRLVREGLRAERRRPRRRRLLADLETGVAFSSTPGLAGPGGVEGFSSVFGEGSVLGFSGLAFDFGVGVGLAVSLGLGDGEGLASGEGEADGLIRGVTSPGLSVIPVGLAVATKLASN